MKNFLYAIISLTFGLSNLACKQHSFYLGATVGVNHISAIRSDSTNTENIYNDLTNKKEINAKNALGGIFAGYLFRYADFGIGPELSWQYTSADNAIEKN